MNRKRCPWCGKVIDKSKDTVLFSPAVPRMLRTANCGHCGHKYGQVPILHYALGIIIFAVTMIVLSLIFQSVVLLGLGLLAFLLSCFFPFSKLNDDGKTCEVNTDLLCKFAVLEKYGEIKRHELYFLDNSFDGFEPFVLASPLDVYFIDKKGDTVSGEFLYMHEKNYEYIEKDSCELYDTKMNLVAKIKFITTPEE